MFFIFSATFVKVSCRVAHCSTNLRRLSLTTQFRQKMYYIKQLDSLRAIAVILAIISHWILPTNAINKIPNGAIGVDIFFVLSGFLITRILFEARNNGELLNISKATILKKFYLRRTLRIFPIYYLVIFLLLFFSKSTGTNIQSTYIYFLTYTSNFYFYNTQQWDGLLSHLWTLAVEEQFYLIWPLIILFINKKYFPCVLAIFILIGIISQYILEGIRMNVILPHTCFDAFGLGAVLSWIITYAPEKLKKFYSVITYPAVACILLLIHGIVEHKWIALPQRTLTSFIALWIITYIVVYSEKESFKFKFILNSRALIFLGKISYGVYLYHNIVPTMLNLNLINKYLNPLLPEIIFKTYWDQLYLLENSILVIGISWLSYIFIEKRFLSLKKHFEFQNIKQ